LAADAAQIFLSVFPSWKIQGVDLVSILNGIPTGLVDGRLYAISHVRPPFFKKALPKLGHS
jgi:hypothetical protein